MIYLIDPQETISVKPCKTNTCTTLCLPVFCAVKPLYGIGP
jgi:hypothetical protein